MHKKIATRFAAMRSMNDDELVEVMSNYASMSVCNMVCGGECTAIDSLKADAATQCKEKIRAWMEEFAGLMEKPVAKNRSCDSCFWYDMVPICPDKIDRGIQCGIDCFGCICGKCEEGSKFKPNVELAQLNEPEWKHRMMQTFLGGR